MSDGFFKRNAQYLFRAWVDFRFHPRPGVWLVRLGTLLLLALLAGWTFGASIPTANGPLSIGFSTGGTPLFVSIAALAVALLFIALGVSRVRRDFRNQDRQRVIVLEVRGLRDTSGTPLTDAVPKTIRGRRIPILADLRQGQDGAISAPDIALKRIEALPFNIADQESGADRADVQLVLGGLAPVPYSFLTGLLVDDESKVTVMDWNRGGERWAALDQEDDGRRFVASGLDAVPADADAVVLAVSVSYGVDHAGIAAAFPGLPLVELKLEDGGPDAHWSAEKQAALARQFHEMAIALGNRGVRLVHLILAAQNSVVLNFGRAYDKRNLPPLIVYQYERGRVPAYPWGVQMPVAGAREATLINRDGTA
ncbi:MAG TPA: SAVED domain-containing protein [Allosphingosinicella sp.]|nr:SAVED domain-containing protein [Allosphingosinicella sp.]